MTNDTKTSIQLLDEVRIVLQQVTEWTQRYEAALQATRQVLYDWQAQTDTILWGGATEPLLGYDRAELPATWDALQALVHPTDRAAIDHEQAHPQASPSGSALSYRLRRKDGGYVTVADQGLVFVDHTGTVVRRVGCLADITWLPQSQKNDGEGLNGLVGER